MPDLTPVALDIKDRADATGKANVSEILDVLENHNLLYTGQVAAGVATPSDEASSSGPEIPRARRKPRKTIKSKGKK